LKKNLEARRERTKKAVAEGRVLPGSGRSENLAMAVQRESWPTPRVSSANGSSQREAALGNPKKRLETEAEMKNWATPTARDYKDGSNPSEAVPTNSLLGRQAPRTQMDGSKSSENDQTSPPPSPKRLNPNFVEWLMAVPIGWTDLKPLEMDSFHQWLQNFYEG